MMKPIDQQIDFFNLLCYDWALWAHNLLNLLNAGDKQKNLGHHFSQSMRQQQLNITGIQDILNYDKQ